ncbi:phosphatidylserine decarboxylase [Aquimarina sp. 2201CG5-10]|uniref:phosphatidylserine decarboxylase n=1 Tax=Aquimarina callyspongiae TaxID=3098150 RepID=UPI002AB46437|nr:phosphatidylserine decarboxylase [Aquimarina sp. 2201CG5-10]MDY8137467.1 phosphatidylserine decarboxylase [Aquimarina sp. 2201CG5-10]
MEAQTTMETHQAVVEQLKTILDGNPDMANSLGESLKAAVDLAKNGNPDDNVPPLNEDLYKAIDKEFNGKGWPKTVEDYYDYLDLYVRMVPNESRDPEYPTAWTSDGTKNGYNQKVYDLLCQSYWLVDQPDTNGNTMQSYPEFANWLVSFATAWGTFLDTEASLTEKSLQSFKDDVNAHGESVYNFPLYADNEKSWTTFNQFFYREFNQADPKTGISPLRPIADPDDNTTIVSPADCTFKAYYPIDKDGNVNEKITLKGTHTIGTVDELLQYSKYGESFYGGTFIHYFLSPFDYHRFHTPVSGEVLEILPVQGKVYLNVDMASNGQFDAPDGGKDGYEFTQSRGLLIMDAGSEVGKVAILPIGMCQVSGVDMYTELQGQTVVKGQEFGKFKFGGSDIIMLFEKPPQELYMFQRDPALIPIHFQYGQTSVYWNK